MSLFGKPKSIPKTARKERWVFTEKELKEPRQAHRDDEFIAWVNPCLYLTDVTEEECDEMENEGVVVKRNGRVTNRFYDGTFGVHDDLAAAADDVETLSTPEGDEYADTWRDVWVGDDGRFLRFA